MDIVRIATLVAAALLAAAFWASARVLGGRLAGLLRQEGLPASTTTALGLAAFALAGVALGAFGLLWWPVVAVLALLPAATALPKACRRARGSLAEAHPEARDVAQIVATAAPVALACVALATLPVFHYDLLTNYLGVAKQYLLAHRIAPLPWNIFSSASLPLHALLTYPLALNALLGEGPFAFGWGSVFGFFHLLCLVGAAQAMWDVARRLVPRAAGYAAALGTALWLTMPQSLLLDALRNVEFVTTFFALAIVAGVVAAPAPGAAAIGALCGFLVAAKAQHGAWALVAAVVLVWRARSWRPLPAFAAGGAVLLAPQLIRNWAAFGSPLFPYAGGAEPWRTVADHWLATNAVALPHSAAELGRRLVRLATLQPESGFTLVLLLLALIRRVRVGVLWLFVLAPVLALTLTSAATYHVLRWIQPALALALLVAAANAAALTIRRPTTRWALAALPLASLVLALQFTGGLLGRPDQLLLAPDEIVAHRLPSLASRADLVGLAPDRVLYLGEINGYYGAENGVLPAPPNVAMLNRYLAGTTASEVGQRLAAAGFRLLAVNPTPPASLAHSAPGMWADDRQRRALADFLARAPEVAVRGPLRVVRVLSAPASRPSPP